jgi:hypothetical protein
MRHGQAGLRYSVEMRFLLQRTGAALAMTAGAVGRVGFLLLVVAALAFDVGCPRLA